MSKSILIVALPDGKALLNQEENNEIHIEWDGYLWTYLYSANGVEVTESGECVLCDLPSAEKTVGILMPEDVAWHRVLLPNAPPTRLKAVLFGLLEEHLLGEPHEIHLARSRFASLGHEGWVAATRAAHLNICLNAFKNDNRVIDSVVPLFEPFDDLGFASQTEPEFSQDTQRPLRIHVERARDPRWLLVVVTRNGILRLPSTAPMVQTWLTDASVVWSAEPDITDAVSQWVGQEVMPVAKAQRMWLAAQDGSNLLQFDLAVSSKGVRRYKQWLSQIKGQSWRPIYVGLAFLVLAHAMGLQFYAWSISRLVRLKQDEIHAIAQQTFPSIQVVLDASKQMQNELDLRKNQKGEAGSHDFETLLNEVSSAWPTEKPWATQIDYESGELSLSISNWSEEEFQHFKNLPLFHRWDVQMQMQSNILTMKKN